MANLFGKAKAIEITKPAAKKDTKELVNLTGLEELAQIDAAIKALTSMKKTVEADVKAEAFDHFFDKVVETHKRPDNFRGVEGIATASIEFRKRSTTSPITEEEMPLFVDNKIPLETIVTVQKLFGINPAYANNDALLEKVSAALEGIVPDDFIVVQEEVSKKVVSEEAMDAVFAAKRPNFELVKAISVMAIKPKLEKTDLPAIMEALSKMMTTSDDKDDTK
jgi:adenosyl cobinamide kinase/adenosyl cobinamide phosphate guanylyltransferase